MKLLAIPIVVIAWMLSTPSVSASGRDIGPTDDAAQPCINAYYGIDESVDYIKAYKCFDSLHVYQFLVLMQLNGQGVPPNAARAKEIMEEWRKGNPDYTDEDLFAGDSRLAKILKQKIIEVPISPRLDFCNDVASFGFEWRFCSNLDNTVSEQQTDQEFAKIRTTLSPKDAALWDAIVKAFDDYVQAEGNRGEDQYAGGTMAAQGFNNQQIYVRKSFLRFAQRTFVDMKLEPISKDELSASEGIMKRAYDEAIAHHENTDDAGIDADQEEIETEARYLDQAKSNLAASQKSWLDLQDQCIKLAVSLYAKKEAGNWRMSTENALDLVRAADIEQGISD